MGGGLKGLFADGPTLATGAGFMHEASSEDEGLGGRFPLRGRGQLYACLLLYLHRDEYGMGRQPRDLTPNHRTVGLEPGSVTMIRC